MPRGGRRVGAGRKRSYESYKQQYLEKQAKLASKGISMADTMLSKAEFDDRYTRYLNTAQDEISSGKRKVVGNITRDIIDDQAYQYSRKQAQVFKTAWKETHQGSKAPTLQKLRAGAEFGGADPDWEVIKTRQQELLNSGMDWNDVQTLIGQEFFGSP